MTRRALIIVLASGAVVLGLCAFRAHATTPGRNGLIAFTRYRLQDSPIVSEIFVAQPDGSGVRRVSHSTVATEDDEAQWSPKGDLIVFHRCVGDRPCSIWVVRPDGSGQRPIKPCSEAGCDESAPSFSPDGRHLVFERDWGHVKQGSISDNDQIEHAAIVETDLAGGHLTVLRRADGYSGGFDSPRISPDGRRLLFGHYGWDPAHVVPEALYVVDLNGGAPHRLTPFRMQAQAGDWSPDGKLVLFKPSLLGVSELTAGTNMYTVGADGTHLRRITDVGGNHYVIGGSFSPDGNSIVFATDDGATTNPRGNTFADVFTLRLGTSSPQAVTRTANLDGWPSWGSGT